MREERRTPLSASKLCFSAPSIWLSSVPIRKFDLRGMRVHARWQSAPHAVQQLGEARVRMLAASKSVQACRPHQVSLIEMPTGSERFANEPWQLRCVVLNESLKPATECSKDTCVGAIEIAPSSPWHGEGAN